MQTSEQLNLLPMAEQVPLCKQLRFHVWALNGANRCECGNEVIGPSNCPDHWLPGAPITTCWDIMTITTRPTIPPATPNKNAL